MLLQIFKPYRFLATFTLIEYLPGVKWTNTIARQDFYLFPLLLEPVVYVILYERGKPRRFTLLSAIEF